MDIIVTLQTAGLQTLAQVRAFIAGTAPVSFVRIGFPEDRRQAPAKPFARRYTAADIRRLAAVDALRTGHAQSL